MKGYLSSLVAITNDSGSLTSQQRYLPFGQARADVTTPNGPTTDLSFTGQRDLGMGLLDYHARFYSPVLGRFAQPDSIIPNPANPQAFNRFSYVLNSPLNYTDPTGHYCADEDENGKPIHVDCETGEASGDGSNNNGNSIDQPDSPTLILACGFGAGPNCDNTAGYDGLPLAPYYQLSGNPFVFGVGNSDDKLSVARAIYDLIKNNPGLYNLVGHSAGGSAVILAVEQLLRDGYGDRINNIVLLDPAFESLPALDGSGDVSLQIAANSINPNQDPSGIPVFLGDVVKGDGDDAIEGAYEFQTDQVLTYEVTHKQLATNLDIYNMIVNDLHWRP